jgi:hypothetical protein
MLSNEVAYPVMRVVGARIDPCFPGFDLEGPTACRNQLRFVLQPIVGSSGTEPLTAADTALHAFYELTREELVDLLARIVALRAGLESSPSDIVGVHPIILAEGSSSAYAKGLLEVLLDSAGEQNLTRVTFMAVENAGERWRFGGFDVIGGQLERMHIVTLGGEPTQQTFENFDLAGLKYLEAAARPSTYADDVLAPFFDSDEAIASPPDEQLSAYDAALRIENPDLHSPDTIDCVSCHVATPARRWAEKTLSLSPAGNPNTYDEAAYDVAVLPTSERTNVLRAFGYFGSAPAISQRTINETIAVARTVNATLLE